MDPYFKYAGDVLLFYVSFIVFSCVWAIQSHNKAQHNHVCLWYFTTKYTLCKKAWSYHHEDQANT